MPEEILLWFLVIVDVNCGLSEAAIFLTKAELFCPMSVFGIGYFIFLRRELIKQHTSKKGLVVLEPTNIRKEIEERIRGMSDRYLELQTKHS